MEEKLYLRNRGDGDYFLESRTNNSASVVGSLNPTHFAEHKLSIENCQDIERGYDLDELADKYISNNKIYLDNYKEESHSKVSFIDGFQKALEILGDKKFSKQDVKKAYMIGWNSCNNFNGNDESQEFIESPGCIQSLQQTEWEVEIVMKKELDSKLHDDGREFFWIDGTKHLLDADGCLILKRK
jgi:hypothetical protein